MRPLLCAVGVVAASLLVSERARAAGIPTLYDNYQMFPVGSRAAGMGGAYTALACDEGALHYNPAALACAADSHLELAANAYMIQAASVPNAVGRGQDVSAVTYHSIPSIVGGVRILREGDPVTRVGRLAFGLTVSVPQSLALKIDPPKKGQINYVALSVRDDITAGDVGLALQVNRRFAIGLSIGGVLRTFKQHGQALITKTTPTACAPNLTCTDYLQTISDQELLAVGARAKLGARFEATPALSFGLALFSPSLDLFGNASLDTTNAATLTHV